MTTEAEMTSSKVLCAAVIALAAACGGTAESPALDSVSATSTALTGGGGTGGGGGGGGGGGAGACGGLQFFAPLYFVDQPLRNEPALGGYVYVFCKTSTNLPSDLIVTVNGVQLIKVSATNYRASASGPQVSLGADGLLHVVALSATARQSRALDLPCGPLIAMDSTPAAGSSLAGVSTVVLDWSASVSQIPQNTAAGIAFMGWVYSQPTAQLDSYDLALNAPAGVIDQPLLFQDAVSTTLTLRTQTASSGYLAAITYPGAMAAVPDLSTFGYCGRSARITFAK